MYGTVIFHSGIKGMRWGVRRYRKEDGTLTEEGKERYAKRRVFISGSSKTQSEDSPYYRSELPKDIEATIDDLIKQKANIIIGDAPGIDRQVQDYLKLKRYNDVDVYGPGDTLRYIADKRWKQHPIPAPEYEPGSKEWLAKKDKAMQNAATEGLAIVLENGGASATRKNVDALISQNKNVKIYELRSNKNDEWSKL